MTYWPWWLGALALATVAALFTLLLTRPMGVSGLVRTLLRGPVGDGLSRGGSALFLVGIVAGAALSASLVDADLSALSPLMTTYFDGPLVYVALGGGGVLVGAGTRLAGGCTSGHGLVGCARLQPGSLAATAAFFGTGVAAALVMKAVLS